MTIEISFCLKEFGNNTNVGGLNNAANSRSFFRKFVWMVLFGVLFYHSLANIYALFEDIHDHSTVSNVEERALVKL